LDKKASQIIGFVGIIFSLFAGFYALVMKDLAENVRFLLYYSDWKIVILLAIFLLALSVFCCIKTLHVRTFYDAPDTMVLINDYAKAERDVPTILRDVGTEISRAVEDNKKINDDKADFVKYSTISFASGMLLIMLFIGGLITV